MPAKPSYPLYDRVLDGGLGRFLTESLAEGIKAPEIRDRLRDTYSITVSESTVRRWIAEFETAA